MGWKIPQPASNGLILINYGTSLAKMDSDSDSSSQLLPRSKQKQKQKQTQKASDRKRQTLQQRRQQKPNQTPNHYKLLFRTKWSKRRRGIRGGTSGIVSSQQLWGFVVVFTVLLLALFDNVNSNIISGFLPTVEARPSTVVGHTPGMCTTVVNISKAAIAPTVGLADFGRSLDLPKHPSTITILPESYPDLCEEFPYDKDISLEVVDLLEGWPNGPTTILVDLEAGGCDLLTKSYNALKLQQEFTRNLKYVVFYDSDLGSENVLPNLILDEPTSTTYPPTWTTTTWTPTTTYKPTDQPTYQPTYIPTMTWTPTTNPTGTPHPSPKPTYTTIPSSAQSTKPNPTTIWNPSQAPTTIPTYTLNPSGFSSSTTTSSSSDTPSLVPLASSSQAPTLTAEPSVSSDLSSEPPLSLQPSSVQPSSRTYSRRSSDDQGMLIIQKYSMETTATSRNNPGSNIYGSSSNSKNTNIFVNSERENREQQKQELENNNSIMFLSIAMGDARVILEGWNEMETSDVMKMDFTTIDYSGESPTCSTVMRDTRKPTRSPVMSPTRSPYTYSPTRTYNYSDNAPGTFTILKFVLFGLLIASPCLRVVHQWWSGGGRIRLRRSSDVDSNRVVGLQYIPPMDNWFGGAEESGEVVRPPDRLSYQQIMGLPEIRYTKPIHSDDAEKAITGSNNNNSILKTIEEKNDLSGSSIHLYNNEDDDENDDGGNDQRIGSALLVVDTPFENNASSNTTSTDDDDNDEGELLGMDEPCLSEASFENEPTIRLEIPTSPVRVSSTITTSTQASNSSGDEPLSPRAIVSIEVVPPDEESPEEQQQQQQCQLISISTATAPSTIQQQQQQQIERDESIHPPPLSFRTQRRLQHFTTTTCTTCSICIDEFEEGETIRLLPRCGHAFHTDCILPWLQDRQGCCPLCKMEVLDQTRDE